MTAGCVWVGVAEDPDCIDSPAAFSAFAEQSLLAQASGNLQSVDESFRKLLKDHEGSRFLVVSSSDDASLPLGTDVVHLTELSRIAYPSLLEQNVEFVFRQLGFDCPESLSDRAAAISEAALRLVEKLAELDHSDLMLLFSFCPSRLHPFVETAVELRSKNLLRGGRLERSIQGRSVPAFFEFSPERARSWKANTEEIESILCEDGLLSQQMDGFEERPEQMELACLVLESFRDQTLSVIEAPTGTGKTLGYLVPSFLWTCATGRRVVVSTHTITLQDQLFFKDAPSVMAALQLEGRISILKGRRNYLCLRRWKSLRTSGIPEEERGLLGPVVTWLSETESGDVSENSGLDLSDPNCRKAWGRISCEIPYCPAARCPEYRRCYLFKARKAADTASLIVINHSLLFCDRFLGNALLPSFEELVIDEAHSLEAVARDQLGVRVSQGRVGVALSEVSDVQEPRLLEKLSEISKLAASSEKTTLEPVLKRAKRAVRKSRKEATAFFDRLDELSSKLSDSARHAGKIRYSADDAVSRELSSSCLSLGEGLDDISRELKTVAALASDLPGDDSQSALQEIETRAEDFSRLEQDLHSLCNPVEGESVYWVECGSGRRPELRSSPVELKQALSDLIYDEISSLVLTSGTLSYQGGFEHTSEMLGVSSSRTRFHRLESSFPLSDQVELLATSSLPRPDSKGYLEAVSEFIGSLFEDDRASTLALFTSYSSLESIYSKVEGALSKSGVKVFCQGRGEAPQRIAELFRQTRSSLLLGTMSFWEGVDLPGECLERLVITRIPFPVPTEPVVEGIMERLQTRGEDPFQKYMLPVASIRLRQGFGRLIRSKDDKGMVIILDSRFLGSSYGSMLVAEMPVDVEPLPGDRSLSGTKT